MFISWPDVRQFARFAIISFIAITRDNIWEAIVSISAFFSEDYSEGRRAAVMISKYNKHV